MTEWHLTPEYILNNWTEEELNLMVEKLIERKKRQDRPDNETITDSQMFAMTSHLGEVK